MAIQWGGYDGQIRVGLDVDWGTPGHYSDSVGATIRVYTQNSQTFSDSQQLNYGGAIGGSQAFSNNAGTNVVQRDTLHYTYTYSNNDYGDSPGGRVFTARLSGAYNGASPSVSVTSKIPARPFGAPAAPTNVQASRISDSQQRVTWSNHDTTSNPWDSVIVQRSRSGGDYYTIGTTGGGASSYTDSNTDPNNYYRYRVASKNKIDQSNWIYSDTVWTSPAAPSSAVRTGPVSGPGNQTVTWANNVNYTQFQTQIWRAYDGVWAQIALRDNTYTSFTDTPDSTRQVKYRVRHVTTSGPDLLSAFSNETSATSGQTNPPYAPSALVPNGSTLDPTFNQTVSWTYNTRDGSGQSKFQIQHRKLGTTAWNIQGSVAWPANPQITNTWGYTDGDQIEWQVRTWGADPSPSPWSNSAKIIWAFTPIASDPIKLPLQVDMTSGHVEASTTANELSNYIMRTQAQILGGGVKACSTSYVVSWSQRFLAISFGASDTTFPHGYHEIVMPTSRTISSVSYDSSGQATFNLPTSGGAVVLRAGESFQVTGVGVRNQINFDGFWRVVSATTYSLTALREDGVTYPLTYPTTSVSGANLGPKFAGHGGAASSSPIGGITLPQWTSLWYEMPFGWGGGTTPRKNGVQPITRKSLSGTTATLTTQYPHSFAVGDRVIIQGVDSTFDTPSGTDTITAITATTFSYTRTGTAVPTDTPATGTVFPTGIDTFRGNYHLVSYTQDFVVPDNWIFLCLRNADLATIEWATGEQTDPGYDSDSPVLKQVVLTSTSDVNASASNKPPLRVGNISGSHLRVDGDEIQRMSDDNTVSSLSLNANGGAVNIGRSNGTYQVNVYGKLFTPDYDTSTQSANVYMGAGGKIYMASSARKTKRKIRDMLRDPRDLLKLRPRWYRSRGGDDPKKDFAGFIADEAADLGFEEWVDRDEDGEPRGFHYGAWTAALQAICRYQEERIDQLETRIATLENRG